MAVITTYAMPQAAAAAGPQLAGGARWLRRLERAALFYIIAISATVFGFVDISFFGDDYRKLDASPFAQVLWPLAYLLFGGLILVHLQAVLDAVRRSWWVVLLPLAAALSVLWSVDPPETANAAVRIAMTVAIGVLLGARFQGFELARAVFVVLFLAVACSVAAALAGMDFAIMLHGETRGLFTHKNTLGSRAALLFMVALALLLSRWRPLLTLTALPVAVSAVILSQSAAGVAATVIVGALAPVVLTLRGSDLHVLMRIALVAAGLFALCFLMVLLRFDPVVSSLEALGRDATLTGRLLLWEAAVHHMAERPLLGTGFGAFWSGAVDWRTLLVLEELGNVLNFHNAFLEMGVQLGCLGLAVVLITLIGYGRAALRALRDPAEPAPLWPVLFGLIVLALSLVEAALFMKHSLTQILLIAVPVAVARQASRAPALQLGPRAGVPVMASGAQPVEAHQSKALHDALPHRTQDQRQQIRPPREEG